MQSLLAGFQLVEVYEREVIAMAAEVIAELLVGRIITQNHEMKRLLGLSHKVIQKF